MSNSLNIQLTTELRYVNLSEPATNDVYATPSEFIRDLIRKDRTKES